MSPQFTVYSKPNCVQCDATHRALTNSGINYTPIDLTQDETALAKIQELGYLQAPVVLVTFPGTDTPDKHWSGFKPDQIAALASHEHQARVPPRRAASIEGAHIQPGPAVTSPAIAV